ncbi:MAG: Mur ligase domain-containing protein, partial [Dehalococcoidia bacterium]
MILLDDLLSATGEGGAGTDGPVFARCFDAIAYDSRTVRPGDLFVAVKTVRADGHDHLVEACLRGAAGVLCEHAENLGVYGVTCIIVPDSRAALIAWARFVLERDRPDVIA